MTGTDLNPLNPAAGGLPSEAQMLAWAAEFCGESPAASSPAATSGTDWTRLASDVLGAETAASEAYSPTLVSAKDAGASPTVSTGEKTLH